MTARLNDFLARSAFSLAIGLLILAAIVCAYGLLTRRHAREPVDSIQRLRDEWDAHQAREAERITRQRGVERERGR